MTVNPTVKRATTSVSRSVARRKREARSGRKPPGESDLMASRIVLADRLREEHLIGLAEERYLIVSIPGYYSPRLCAKAARRIKRHPRFGYYGNAPDIGRAGIAFFETINADYSVKERYYSEAHQTIADLRDAFFPYQSPMDHLRLEVQELWPNDAPLMNLDGRPMFVGLPRVFKSGGEALPHQDILRRDAPNCVKAHELITQLAANIYLETSGSGGELEVWNEVFTDSEYEAARMPGSYGLDRSKIPTPAVTVAPEVGDLILFNATHIHAVRSAMRGARVTISCFIGYRGRNQPLCFWS